MSCCGCPLKDTKRVRKASCRCLIVENACVSAATSSRPLRRTEPIML